MKQEEHYGAAYVGQVDDTESGRRAPVNRKRVAAFCLAACMVVPLAGCGEDVSVRDGYIYAELNGTSARVRVDCAVEVPEDISGLRYGRLEYNPGAVDAFARETGYGGLYRLTGAKGLRRDQQSMSAQGAHVCLQCGPELIKPERRAEPGRFAELDLPGLTSEEAAAEAEKFLNGASGLDYKARGTAVVEAENGELFYSVLLSPDFCGLPVNTYSMPVTAYVDATGVRYVSGDVGYSLTRGEPVGELAGIEDAVEKIGENIDLLLDSAESVEVTKIALEYYASGENSELELRPVWTFYLASGGESWTVCVYADDASFCAVGRTAG